MFTQTFKTFSDFQDDLKNQYPTFLVVVVFLVHAHLMFSKFKHMKQVILLIMQFLWVLRTN